MDGIFLQQLVNGLTLGSVYGLIAIGYTMVYGIIGMINFAHGEVYMISAYLAAISLALLAYFGIESFPLLMLGTLVFTIVVTGVYGWVIERVAYKPLRNSTRLAPLISAIGISLILQNYAQISQGARQQGVPTLLTGAWRIDVGSGFVQLTYTTFDFYAGFVIGIKAFTAAVLGGIGSLPGAMLGGIILGISESLFSGLVNSDYKDVFSFSLLVLVLVFRPQGLLGRPLVSKV
jgi:branched-chain amino acid transport system permease protein